MQGLVTWSSHRYFYPRPPRGGRPAARVRVAGVHRISIHALREEGDALRHVAVGCCGISIHALREEGDITASFSRISKIYFYPRPPRGGRLATHQYCNDAEPFLSTPSARRATCPAALPQHHLPISIHALREEGDVSFPASCRDRKNFYPRPPRGGRPRPLMATSAPFTISIHALREEGDSKNRDKISIFKQIVQHSARI